MKQCVKKFLRCTKETKIYLIFSFGAKDKYGFQVLTFENSPKPDLSVFLFCEIWRCFIPNAKAMASCSAGCGPMASLLPDKPPTLLLWLSCHGYLYTLKCWNSSTSLHCVVELVLWSHSLFLSAVRGSVTFYAPSPSL